MFFQRFSGANAFNYYAVLIFRQTLGGMNPHGATIAIGFVQLCAALLSGTPRNVENSESNMVVEGKVIKNDPII